jgi:osmotically-inducible protein OsmY
MSDRWDDRNRSDFRDDRGYRDRDRGERGVIDRAGDEVRSWLGDDDAARRRRMDEVRDERYDRDERDRMGRSGERAWDRARETVRNVTDRDRDGRRGLAEWNDRDRTDWSSERSFGDTRRYATADPYIPPSPAGTSYAEPRDWGRPSYAGRGPRGYQRSDERIREHVCDLLTDDARVDASDIDIQVINGEVTLAGSVRSRDEKRFTEDLVERITGVREVNNNIKVRPPDQVLGTARSGASVLGLSDTPPPAAPPKSR